MPKAAAINSRRPTRVRFFSALPHGPGEVVEFPYNSEGIPSVLAKVDPREEGFEFRDCQLISPLHLPEGAFVPSISALLAG